MSDSGLDHPLVKPHFERLEKFAQECGLNAEQLQKLSMLIINVANARASLQRQRKREANEPLRLCSGTGF